MILYHLCVYALVLLGAGVAGLWIAATAKHVLEMVTGETPGEDGE